MYASPTVGRLGVLEAPAAVNQACCALVPRPEYGAWFLLHALLETRDRLQHLATGAAQQRNLTDDQLESMVGATLSESLESSKS